MPSETIITQLKLLGQNAYVAGMRAAASNTAALDTSTSRLGRTAGSVGGRIDSLAGGIWRLGTRLGEVAAITGAAGVAIGLNFQANMERAEIGMQTLVKSGDLARRTVENVRDFALKAPLFGVEQMMQSAQQLIGAGYEAKGIVGTLTRFSDTLSAMGRKPEDLQRMTYAFVQMMSKGQISAEELRGQLGEIFPAQRLLAKEMGITSRQLAKKMKEGAIKGKKPLLLLLRAMEREYGGATEKMNKTFSGQLANLKEQSKFVLGTLFQPLFFHLRDDIFPGLRTFGDTFQSIMASNQMTAQQKWAAIKDAAKMHLKPMVDDFGRWIEEADIAGKVGDAMDAALPVVMDKASDWGWQATKAFARAWWDADLGTKLFTAALVLGKMGVFRGAGTAAAEIFMRRWKAKMDAPSTQATVGESGKKMGSKWGRAMGRAAAVGALLAFGYLFWPEIKKQLDSFITETKERAAGVGGGLWKGLKQWGADITEPFRESKGSKDLRRWFGKGLGWVTGKRELGGPVAPKMPYVVGERGPELFVPRVPGMIQPDLTGGFNVTVPANFIVDGKVFARSVAKTTAEQMARR